MWKDPVPKFRAKNNNLKGGSVQENNCDKKFVGEKPTEYVLPNSNDVQSMIQKYLIAEELEKD